MTTKEKPTISKAYIASPLGFSEAGRLFYNTIFKPQLAAIGLTLIDPWILTSQTKIDHVNKMKLSEKKQKAWAALDNVIGHNNSKGLDEADIIIALLDGVDVDSGTASEIGYAAGSKKYIEGYRGDFRLSADNIGSKVNLQVEYFIRAHNGDISDSVKELTDKLQKKYNIIKNKKQKNGNTSNRKRP